MRQTWELLIEWHEMVIRVLRTRRNPHQLALPLLPNSTSLPILLMSCSNLCDGVPFEFLSSYVAGETIILWNCHNFPCARANSMVAYPTSTEVGKANPFLLYRSWLTLPQIGLMMTHGYVHLRWVNGFSKVEWRNDPLCHNMDVLWGFMIWAGEQCCMSVLADLRDPVLWRLLKVELDRNSSWCCLLMIL